MTVVVVYPLLLAAHQESIPCRACVCVCVCMCVCACMVVKLAWTEAGHL